MAENTYISYDSQHRLTLRVGIATSVGVADAEKIIATGTDGKIDPRLLTPNVIIEYVCDIAAQVGDLVYLSTTVDNRVVVAEDNLNGPVIGVVNDKPSDMLAGVKVTGLLSGLSGLTRGKRIYVSGTGTITTTPNDTPGIGYMQVLGVASSSSEAYFKPEHVRVKRR